MVGAANKGFSRVQPLCGFESNVLAIGTSACQWLIMSFSKRSQNSQCSASNATSCRAGFRSSLFRGSTPILDDVEATEVLEEMEDVCVCATFLTDPGYFTPVPPRPQYPSGFFFR